MTRKAAELEETPGEGSSPGPWYRDGLRFSCTKCGACCTGTSGYVWVEPREAKTMADVFGMPLDEFGRRYLRRIGRRYALLENEVSGDCALLREGRCLAYASRPSQCRSYPFWSAHLRDADAWKSVARECEGIAADAPLISAGEIDRRAGRCR